MSEKFIVSDYTYRTIDQQSSGNKLPVFLLPNDLSYLFRETQRKEKDTFYCASLGVLAETEKDFRSFMRCAKKIGATINAKDGVLPPWVKITDAVAMWKKARKSGTGKIGADIAAKNREAKTLQAIALIEDRWPLPSNEWSTPVLLKEAGIVYNTAIRHLGKRPIAQYNYQAAQKRKERRNAKN